MYSTEPEREMILPPNMCGVIRKSCLMEEMSAGKAVTEYTEFVVFCSGKPDDFIYPANVDADSFYDYTVELMGGPHVRLLIRPDLHPLEAIRAVESIMKQYVQDRLNEPAP